MNKKNDIKRINVRLPEYIQDWYKEQGEKYSVPYSNYMALLLTQIYENDFIATGKKETIKGEE